MVNIDYANLRGYYNCDPLECMRFGVESIIRSVLDIYFSNMVDEFVECDIYSVKVGRIHKINGKLRICVQCYDHDYAPHIRADYVWDDGQWCVVLYNYHWAILSNKFGVLIDAAKFFPSGDELSKPFRDSIYDYQHYFMLMTSICMFSVASSYFIINDRLYLLVMSVWIVMNCVSASSFIESKAVSSFSFLFFLGFISSSTMSVATAVLFDDAIMFSVVWFVLSLCYQLSKYQVYYRSADRIYDWL